jgi:hypothetical protein
MTQVGILIITPAKENYSYLKWMKETASLPSSRGIHNILKMQYIVQVDLIVNI